MGERMTSRDEADEMQAAFRSCVDALERNGLSRGQIGAGMTGFAFGIHAAHNGLREALASLEAIRAALGEIAP